MPIRLRRLSALILAMAMAAVALGLFAYASAAGADPVAAAWERARAAGGYSFASDVVQVTTPAATPANIGRASREERLRLEGQTDLASGELELRLWAAGGSLADSAGALEVRVADGKTFARQAGGAWQEAPGLTDSLAPQGDFLAYLAAVRDRSPGERQERAGVAFTRYTFSLDGPTFAAYLRDRIQAALQARGELPPGTRFELPDYYARMAGTGELWVGADGLPLRQTLDLRFPEYGGEQVRASISVDFGDFGPGGPVAPLPLGEALATLAALGLGAALTFALIRHRRSRRMALALAAGMIVALVAGPLLQSLRVRSFLDAQSAQAAAGEQQREQARALQAVAQQQARPGFDPQADPLAAAQAAATARAGELQALAGGPDGDADGVSDAEEARLGTNQAAADSDGDGLSDSQELIIQTDPRSPDSDGDALGDGQEVTGGLVSGRRLSYDNLGTVQAITWRGDPLSIDSNRDGLADTLEWDSDDNGRLDDGDGDGVPNLFDRDNDGDGVPDSHDLAPFAQSGATAFSGANPLRLSIAGLTPGKPTLVDFQLRPTEAGNLRFAQNVLDWPDDRDGQIQDWDGVTLYDAAVAAGEKPAPADRYGDMKLVPMLEIRVKDTAKALPTQNLPTQAELDPFGISVFDQTEAGSEKYLYVRLNLVVDEQSGSRVAFSGRMRYQPTGSWETPHEVRLVWVLQGLVDSCKREEGGACVEFGDQNTLRPIQTYYDDWTLTGLNVREDHGASVAIIYEDPQSNAGAPVDANLKDDTALWAFAHGLDRAFLAGRCAARTTDNQCAEGATRELTLDTIAARFDYTKNSQPAVARLGESGWGLPNVLRVERPAGHAAGKPDYPLLDLAVATTAMTKTVDILNEAFKAPWQADPSIKPLLLFAREEQYRALGLDVGAAGGMDLDDGALRVSFRPEVPTETLVGMRWAAYCPRAGAGGAPVWEQCAHEGYWQELERRNPPAANDSARGALMLAQLYFQSLAQGVQRVVAQNNRILLPGQAPELDGEIAGTVKTALDENQDRIVTLVETIITIGFDPGVTLQSYLGNLWNSAKAGVLQGYAKIKELFAPGSRLKGALIVGGVLLAVAGLAVGAYFLIKYYLAGDPAAQLAAKIVTTTLITGIAIYTGLISTLMSVVGTVRSLIETSIKAGAAISTAMAVKQVMGSSSSVIGASKLSGVIGVVIGAAITWGFFIASMVASKTEAFSPQFNAALAETIAATIYLIIMAVISATVIGTIIAGVIAAIDGILTAICELGVDELRDVPGMGGSCFTLGTAATKAIAKALYSYDSMINIERQDLVTPGAPNLALRNPARGYVAGAGLTLTLPVTSTAAYKKPAEENWNHILPYLWLFSEPNLKSSTFRYTISGSAQPVGGVGRGQMSDKWAEIREYDRFAATPLLGGVAGADPKPSMELALPATPGINSPIPFYLNMGYAVPAYECWAIPNIILPHIPPYIPVCYLRTLDGSNSSQLDLLRLDVLPASFAEFVELEDKGGGRWGPAWGAGSPISLPPMADADGDGYPAGVDADDRSADRDGDGLSDGFELGRRTAGVALSPDWWDTDNDGLNDGQEMSAGTSPVRADSDNDGLRDGEEVFHEGFRWDAATRRMVPSGVWAGGWLQSVGGKEVLVTSDPTLADGDGDGLNDATERELARQGITDDSGRPFHPQVFNASPLRLTLLADDADGFVAPGQSVAYSTIVATRGARYEAALLEQLFPPALGGPGALPPRSLSLGGADQRVDNRYTVPAGQASTNARLSAAVSARLPNNAGAEWVWDTAQAIDLSGYGRPARFVDAAPYSGQRPDSFLFATMASDSAGPAGKGDIIARAIGQRSVGGSIERDTFDVTGAPVIPDGAALRGDTSTGVACAANGNCFVVWDHKAISTRVTLHSFDMFKGDHAEDHGTSGVEPNIYVEHRDRNGDIVRQQLFSFWWCDANGDIEVDDPACIIETSTSFSNYAELVVTEFDTGQELKYGFYSLSHDQPWTRLEWNFDSKPSDKQCKNCHFSGTIYFSVAPIHVHDVLGSVVQPGAGTQGLTVAKPQFSLTSLADNSKADFQPVVASDGNGFLTVWERVTGGSAGTSQLMGRFFTNSGAPLGSEFTIGDALALEADAELKSYQRLDLTRGNGSYQLVRHADVEGRVRTGLYSIAGTRQGPTVQVRGLALDISTTPTERPRIAHNPAAGASMLVYRNQSGIVKGGLITANSYGFRDFPWAGAHPAVAYYPPINGWLVSWTNPNGSLGYAALDANGFPLRAAPAGSQNFSLVNASGEGAALACPAADLTPLAEMRFEELPGATSFADSSGRGATTSCPDGNCPRPRPTPANGGGAPGSSMALAFDGLDDALVITPGVRLPTDFSLSFWYNAAAPGSPAQQTLVDAGDFSLVQMSGRLHLLRAGVPPTNLPAGEGWHFVTIAQHPNRLTLSVDGASTDVSGLFLTPPLGLRLGMAALGGDAFQGQIDSLSAYGVALEQSTIQALRDASLQSFCVAAVPAQANNSGSPGLRLGLQRARLGQVLQASAALSLTVDADRPTSGISLTVDPDLGAAYLRGPGGSSPSLTIGGFAQDATSGVARVDLTVDGAPAGSFASTSVWAYNLPAAEGVYALATTAVDHVGNSQAAPGTATLVVDAKAPGVALAGPPPAQALRQSDGSWVVPFTLAATDPGVADRPGSGVASVELLLEGGAALGDPQGNGWQAAARNADGSWGLSYRLPAGARSPSGAYSIFVRASDRVGNASGTLDAGILGLDVAGPQAALDPARAADGLIAATITLSGTIGDPAGVADLQAAFTPIQQVAALSGTLLLLPLDEPAGASYFADRTTNYADARCAPGLACPSAGLPGAIDGAAGFDGGAGLVVPDSPALAAAEEGLTLQLWLQAPADAPAGNLSLIEWAGSGSGLLLRDGVAGLDGPGQLLAGGPDLRDGAWHHLAVVFDPGAGEIRLYVDGAPVGQGPLRGDPPAGDLLIGAGLVGALDQLALVGRALIDADVQALAGADDVARVPATLTAPGAAASDWGVAVPAGLEGQYQIDLHARDALGNQGLVANAWRGIIDTRAPRVELSGAATGRQYTDPASGAPRYEVAYSYSARDRHLVDAGFVGPCAIQTAERGFDLDPALRELFPDQTVRDRLEGTCTVWEPAPEPQASLTACDIFGHCATAGGAQPLAAAAAAAPAQLAALPTAAIVGPGEASVVAADAELAVTVAAEAAARLSRISVSLEGGGSAEVTFTAGEGITRTLSELRLPAPPEGPHTLRATAADHAGNSQGAPFEARVIVDRRPPEVSIETLEITPDNSYTPGSNIVRLGGAAGDSLGLAAVQVRVGDDNAPFSEATFGDGRWSTALWLGPESFGQTYRITVRATDLAGRSSEATRELAVGIDDPTPVDPAELPTATVTAGPPAVVLVDSASFSFSGFDLKTPAEGLRFQCRLDKGRFADCVSPISYSNLSDGLHRFEVRAIDGDDNVGPAAAYEWTLATSCASGVATIVGTEGDDVLTGTPGVDVILGLGGGDEIAGLGGDDLICGGAGDDSLSGGDGNDQLDGGAGKDRIDGGDGADRISGQDGRDRLLGGAGDDLLLGGQGDDALLGGDGNDLIDGGGGADSLDGGAGDDELFGRSSNDVLTGGSGADRFRGGNGVDRATDFRPREGDTQAEVERGV